jgi:hypothetical protein
MNKKALAVILPIVAIVLLGVFVVKPIVMPDTVDLTVKCTNPECKKEIEAFKCVPTGPWPMACPECKQKTLVRAEIYNDGKKEYILTDEEKEKMSEKVPLLNGKLGQ